MACRWVGRVGPTLLSQCSWLWDTASGCAGVCWGVVGEVRSEGLTWLGGSLVILDPSRPWSGAYKEISQVVPFPYHISSLSGLGAPWSGSQVQGQAQETSLPSRRRSFCNF